MPIMPIKPKKKKNMEEDDIIEIEPLSIEDYED